MTFQVSANLADQVCEHLRDRIISFEIKPGERLYEEKIAGELNVSRGPVREALRLLAKQKLVELIPRRGARVPQITEQHIEWIFEIIIELYCIIARR